MEIYIGTLNLGVLPYERLNKQFKRALRKSLWRSRLTYEELETVVIEIEGVMNSRPLCYVYDDCTEEVLTPSHLMFGRRLANNNDTSTPNDVKEIRVDKRYKYVQSLIGQFFNRFSKEYLTELRERERYCKDIDNSIKVGDVVLIHEKSIPRSKWPLGRVMRLVTSDEGIVRGVVLKTKEGELKRPMNLLYPLEMGTSTNT